MSTKSRLSVPLGAALGTVLLAGSGLALAEDQTTLLPDTIVQYRGMDTSTPAGVQDLANHIRSAAFQACAIAVRPGASGPSQFANLQCRESVIRQTVDQLGNPDLSDMFADTTIAPTYTSE